jgi:hypothetical protein
MTAIVTAYYGRLKDLGCVPCALCDGSYMYPDHMEHRSLFDAIPAVSAPVDPATVDTTEDVPA